MLARLRPTTTRGHAVLALVLVALALAFTLGNKTLLIGRAPGPESAYTPVRVSFQMEGDTAWQDISLPDVWKLRRPDQYGVGLYRLEFELPAKLNKPTLYIPRWSMTGALSWDGRLVDAPVRWDGKAPRQLNIPRLYSLPTDQGGAGRHMAVIRLQTIEGLHGGLSQAFLGEYEAVEPFHRRMILWQPMAQQGIGLSTFFMAMLIGAMGYVLRERGFFYAAWSMACWAVSVWGWGSETAWLGGERWELIYFSARLAYPYLIGVYLYHFYRLPWRWIPGTLIATWLFVVAYALWDWPHGFAAHSTLLFGLPGVFFLGMLAASLVLAVRRHDLELIMVSGTLLAAHGQNLHDLAWWSGTIDYAEPMLSHFAGILLFGAVLAVITRRYALLQRNLLSLNRSLESQVRQRTEEALRIAADAERLRQDRLLQEEREQIYRDLHDDIGAKLLTLAISAPNAEQAQTARSALQDMRAMISHSSQGPTPLAFLLADLRSEAATRCARAGLQFRWEAPDYNLDADGLQVSPTAALDITRVLREAVTNTLKHAQAHSLAVTVTAVEGELRFLVRDDGVGLPVHPRGADGIPGQGLRNMQLRVARWGGTVEWRAAEGGGCVAAWWFPLTAVQPVLE